MKPIFAPLVALVLVACATPTVYQPAASARSMGFSEYRIEQDRFRVTFQGGGGAPEAQVADYALLRAAEITVREGYDWFRITDRATAVGAGSGPQVSVGTGGASFGRHAAVGVGIGTSFDLGGGPALARSIEIMLGRGRRPPGSDVYDAREVMETIGPRARPAP